MSDICPCALGLEVVVEQPLVGFSGVDELVLLPKQNLNFGSVRTQSLWKSRFKRSANDGGVHQPSRGSSVGGEEQGHPSPHARSYKGVAGFRARLSPCRTHAQGVSVIYGWGENGPVQTGEVVALATGSIAFESMKKADVHGSNLTRTMGILSWEPCHVLRLSQF